MKTTEREILPGVTLCAVETQRFKTCSLSVAFLTPLKRSTASANALVPYVLRRGCRTLPDLAAINFELDLLYGATAEPFVYKQGDVQYVGFCCDGVDGAYTDKSCPMTERLLTLVHSLLTDPLLKDGGFVPEYVNSEKENLVSQILSEKNEKLSYAYHRAIASVFSDQGFGLSELGEAECAKALTAERVYQAYRALLKTAPLVITYCGSEPFESVAAVVESVFSDCKRDVTDSVLVSKAVFRENMIETCELMDVNQTVLLVGFSAAAEEFPMKVLSAVLGGGTASKLFINVRERASLCYYTGSVFNARQKTLFAYAGVEDEKAPLAYEKITEQLKACADGNITEEELRQAKENLVNQLQITKDTAGALLSYWIDRAVDAEKLSPSDTAKAIRAVTLQQVCDAAKACECKIVYRLCGKEACGNERKLLPEH